MSLTRPLAVEVAAQAARGDAAPRGLRAIAIAECLKGLGALALAAGLAVTGPAAVRSWLVDLLHLLQVDTRHGSLARLLAAIDPHTLHLAIAITLAYGLLRLVEAWGLWRAQGWASWFGCVSAAVYLPFEVVALVRHPGWPGLLVLLVNLVVVAVLALDLWRRHRATALSNG